MILFLNNSKKPVNVETLEKEIWQHSSELETHTVETHIYRLRKKIKAEFGNDELIKSNKDGYTIWWKRKILLLKIYFQKSTSQGLSNQKKEKEVLRERKNN